MDKAGAIGDWRTVPVKLLDIRRIAPQPGSEPPYRLPANAFLFVSRGEAAIRLDGGRTANGRELMLHGVRGDSLSVGSDRPPLEYYLILYKPLELASGTPAHSLRYHYQAGRPWLLRQLLERMHPLWTEGGELDKLQAFGLFYQFVHEQFRQLNEDAEQPAKPQLADEIADYIRSRLREAISMETLSQTFHYSPHYLSRVFRRKYGRSPLSHLVHARMNRAKQLLAETDVSIRDIAESVGYSDMYYFTRLFKKQTGVTPVQYRMRLLGLQGSIRPTLTSNSFIAPPAAGDYSVDSLSDNHYQQVTWGVNALNRTLKPTLAASLLFAFSLLLAACGGSGTNNVPGASEETGQAAESGTRTYTDALGNRVEIPAAPQRAVVVVYGGYLLPLGLKPVGADQGTLEQYPDELAGVSNIGEGLGSEETIAALQPDLIVVPDYFDPASYANYGKIAPTIAVAWGGDPDVVNTLRDMGDIMNRQDEAEAWIAKFEEKLQRIRDHIDVKLAPGTTAITFIHYEGEFLIGGEGGTLGKLIYKDYGFEMPEQLKQYSDGGAALSEEAFVAQPADYFFTQMTDEELANFKEMIQKPVYRTIPAVQHGRIINVTRDKWNYGPYLVDQAVDELIDQMNEIKS
ncbi:AraC family transcriptional regulator [Cohnella fermenti]|uniref:Helix-turn-helix domain-containing protein n=1 Tax=Cohnella fermenti TaxID=2565925 RepID=A0A4V3WFU2_9BACL|nr:helix-turn-helix domain-containing protein [Cohnella fermenti]THF81648.1 helix-turn-helix domain-containing protein [Cohnella fermenti]